MQAAARTVVFMVNTVVDKRGMAVAEIRAVEAPAVAKLATVRASAGGTAAKATEEGMVRAPKASGAWPRRSSRCRSSARPWSKRRRRVE